MNTKTSQLESYAAETLHQVGILAHSDGDGIAAAAIIKHRFPQAVVYFTNAVNLSSDINYITKKIGNTPQHLFIVDIAINPQDVQKLINALLLLPHTHVHFWDHHDLPANLNHNHFRQLVDDCIIDVSTAAACIAFKGILTLGQERFIRSPPNNPLTINRDFIIDHREIAWLGAMGGISDLKENSNIVQAILDIYDRGLLFYEAFCLKNACRKITSLEKKRTIVRALSTGILPSSHDDIVSAANLAAIEGLKAIDFIRSNVEVYGQIALIANFPVGSKGLNAYMAATLTDSKIGIAWYQDNSKIDMSIRKQHHYPQLNLHEIAHRTSNLVEGKGGGSPDEAGATIPADRLLDFLKALNVYLEDTDHLPDDSME